MITRQTEESTNGDYEIARRATMVHEDARPRDARTAVSVELPAVYHRVDAPASVVAVRKAQQIVWYFFGLLETLLALRFVLLAIGANPANPFFDALLNLTTPLLAPFANLLQTPSIEGATLDMSTIFAMAIYLLLAIAIAKLLEILITRTDGH